jgi:2-polyprenyl-6-methoxyphenol hydroxylase-like FAD-dependent oxidoreductase
VTTLLAETEVLVVGAGPVGLALTHELRHWRVRSITVDERPQRDGHPRAKLVNLRTMAILRRLGLAGIARDAAPLPADFPADVHYLTALTQPPLRTVRGAFHTAPGRDPRFPEPALRLPQPQFEAALERRLSIAGRPWRGWRLESAQEHRDHVTAGLQHTDGRRAEIRARYLIGADGARSSVREVIGARLTGASGVAHSLGAVFAAPELAAAIPAGPAVHYWVLNADLPATPGFGPLDGAGTWFFQAMGVDAGTPATRENAARIISISIGADVPFAVLDVAPWQVHDLQADTYGMGRAYIVGDAAHLHPPTGGFGMNMGIADAHDIAWKIAAVLARWGGTELIASYETERRPIHRRTMDEAMRNFRAVDLRRAPGFDGAGAAVAALDAPGPRYFDSLGLQLGYSYAGSPLISVSSCDAPDGAGEAAPAAAGWVPSAAPGRLLPHVWMRDGSALQDSLGPWFTVLSYGRSDPEPVASAAATLGVPVRVVSYVDSTIRELVGRDLVLVRPDQHVAWRGDRASRPDEVMKAAVGRYAS